MTAQPPSDPRPTRRRSLDFDEFIAVLVAFASLGTVLAWGLTRGNENFLTNQPQLLAIPGFTAGQSSSTTSAGNSGGLVVVPPAAERQAAGQAEQTPSSVPQAVPGLNSVPGVVEPNAPAAIVPVPIPQGQSDNPANLGESSQAPTAPGTINSETTSPETANPSAAAPPASPVAAPFPDVPSDYWAAPFIAALTQRGDITGFKDGTFRPDQPVTRAEFATLIQNTFNQTGQQAPIAFQDLPANFWAANAIDSSVQSGFLKGFPNGTFQPDLPIPRMQALIALTSGLKLAPPSNPPQTLQLFSDRSQVPNWGVPATAAATQSGLVVNYPSPDILNPNQPATRADVAAFLYQALVSTGQLAPIASPYLVRP